MASALTTGTIPISAQALMGKSDEAPEQVPEKPQRPPKFTRSQPLPNLQTIPESHPTTWCPSEDVLARVVLDCAKLSQRLDTLEGEMSQRVDELEGKMLKSTDHISQRFNGLDSVVSLQIHDSLKFRREVEAQLLEAKQREEAELQRLADALHGAVRNLWKLYSADIAALQNSLSVWQQNKIANVEDKQIALAKSASTQGLLMARVPNELPQHEANTVSFQKRSSSTSQLPRSNDVAAPSQTMSCVCEGKSEPAGKRHVDHAQKQAPFVRTFEAVGHAGSTNQDSRLPPKRPGAAWRTHNTGAAVIDIAIAQLESAALRS